MDEKHRPSLPNRAAAEPALPVRRQGLDAGWGACVRHPAAEVFPSIPAPRSSPESRKY